MFKLDVSSAVFLYLMSTLLVIFVMWIFFEKKAVLLGMGNKFELWSELAHIAQIRQSITDEDLSDDMLDLRL